MKWSWILYAVGTMLFWGSYIPVIHSAQLATGGKYKGVWTFLFVGIAYFLTAVLVPIGVLYWNRGTIAETPTTKSITLGIIAGILGAAGALSLIFALMYAVGANVSPVVVPSLVFAGTPIVATLIGLLVHPPKNVPSPMFFVGIVVAAAGASLVLRFRPS